MSILKVKQGNQWVDIPAIRGEANATMLAPEYKDLTYPVEQGQLCVHDGVLYTANQDIQATELWTAAHWTQTSIQEELDVKADKTDTVLETTLSRGRKADTTVGTGSFAFGINVEASGMLSHAEGVTTTASGIASHAEGCNTIASGKGAHAEGGSDTNKYPTASGQYSHAEGSETIASASQSHAEGQKTTASGFRSHAEGLSTTARGANSHAEGYYTIAAGNSSHAGGKYNVEDNYSSWSEWIANTSYAIGDKVKITTIDDNDVTTVVGYICAAANNDAEFNPSNWTADAYINYAEIIGNGSSTSSRSNARALDWDGNEYLKGDVYVHTNSDSTGGYKVAKDSNVAVVPGTGAGSAKTRDYEFSGHAFTNIASGRSSFAEGDETIASGVASHTEGDNTRADKTGAHAEGKGTYFTIRLTGNANATTYQFAGLTDIYKERIVVGSLLYPIDSETHAPIKTETRTITSVDHANSTITVSSTFGNALSNAQIQIISAAGSNGTYSHTEGGSCIAKGSSAHAEGSFTVAYGSSSHAEGSCTKSGGIAAHAEGEYTIAAGRASHVFGRYNIADDFNSLPEWVANTSYAKGDKVKVTTIVDGVSVVNGYSCVIANSDAEFTSYKWSDVFLTHVEIVGNGTSDARSNARTLDWNGNEHLMGNVYVGCNADSTGGTMLPKDVQVNGTSVVANGVANIPPAASNTLGVVKAQTFYGVSTDANGTLFVYGARADDVKSAESSYKPIVPSNQHAAAFYGLAKAAGDTSQVSSSNAVGTYTAAAKAAIQNMIGIESSVVVIDEVSGSTPVITGIANHKYICGEVSSISITPPAAGTIDVIFESGSTPAVLTLQNTVKLPSWFDATTLETNTIYEINIAEGVYGAVMTWQS